MNKAEDLRYFKTSKTDGSTREITRSQARDLLESGYTEAVASYAEMLSAPNIFPFPFFYLEIVNA